MHIVYNYSWLDLTYYKHEKSESKLIQLSSTIKIFFKINSNINIRILFTSCYACTFHFYFVMKYPIRKKKNGGDREKEEIIIPCPESIIRCELEKQMRSHLQSAVAPPLVVLF